MGNNKIRSFTDLNAWMEGHKLVLEIYEITKNFPEEEKFGIVIQLRRCVVSITSNIAEGFSRKSYKEKIQFLYMSLGSVTELQNQLIICRDVKYITSKEFQKIAEQTIIVSKLINGMIKNLKIHTT